MGKIIVTGGAGFIGSHTTDLLLKEGHEVLVIDNLRTGHRRNLAEALKSSRCRLEIADVAEEGVMDGWVKDFQPDAIIHLAALVSVQESIENPDLNRRLNYISTQRVTTAMEAHGVKRVVFASSAAIYGDTTDLPISEEAPKKPISPYGEAKWASEEWLHARAAAAGFTARCQRYFNVFGPRQDPASPYSGVISIFDRRYRDGKPVTIYGDGQQTRDFISVHDVARANVIAAMAPGIKSGSANVCTGHATSLLEIVNVFASHYPKVSAPSFAEARKGDIVHSLGRPDRVKEQLGFVAVVPVAEGLGELIRLG